jgi:hypothetical protein
MANRGYLAGTNERIIYPSFGDGYDAEVDTYLTTAGCIPLAWLLLFRTVDLETSEFTLEDGSTLTATAPVTSRTAAIHTLTSRTAWVSELFKANGGLSHHLGLFRQHLDSGPHDFLTIEMDEIEWLHEEDEVQRQLGACLDALDRRLPSVKESLVWLSTILVDRQFRTPDDASADEDRWNYYRILGGGFLRPAPWD